MVTVDTMRLLVTVAFTAFVTEWLCALPLEIKYIWHGTKLCPLKLFFLSARYITMVNLVLMMVMFHGHWSYETCQRFFRLMPILAMLGLLAAQSICVVRIWSIHKRNGYVLALLLTMLAGVAGVQAVAVTQYSVLSDSSGSCIAAGSGFWLSAFWVAPAILDTCIMALALVAVVREIRRHGYNNLLLIILRDQFLYFVVVFAACVTSGVLMTVQSAYLQSLNNPPAITVSSVAATRIVLTLKRQGAKGLYSQRGAKGKDGQPLGQPSRAPFDSDSNSSGGTPSGRDNLKVRFSTLLTRSALQSASPPQSAAPSSCLAATDIEDGGHTPVKLNLSFLTRLARASISLWTDSRQQNSADGMMTDPLKPTVKRSIQDDSDLAPRSLDMPAHCMIHPSQKTCPDSIGRPLTSPASSSRTSFTVESRPSRWVSPPAQTSGSVLPETWSHLEEDAATVVTMTGGQKSRLNRPIDAVSGANRGLEVIDELSTSVH